MGASRRDSRDIRQFLAESEWGRHLTCEELDVIAATARQEFHEKGESIVLVGTRALQWIGLTEGLAVQSIVNFNGDVAMLSAVGPGGWFGEGTLLRCGSWQYDATVLRPTRTVQIPATAFSWLRETSLSFNHFLIDSLNDRVTAATSLLISARSGSVQGKVCTVLLQLSRALIKDHQFAAIPVSQGEIANLAGVSRSRAGEALLRLQALGHLAMDRKGIRIADRSRLASLNKLCSAAGAQL